MFVSMLCIIFDIKDYEDDQRQNLKTIVVQTGLLKTIFLIVIPLSVLGLGTFIYYALTHSFHPGKIILNTIPFLLLIGIAYSLKKYKSILYYFIIIDGLLVVKAICGTIAITYF
jgi:4-hydroxybenzoate polyprenyltransferase